MTVIKAQQILLTKYTTYDKPVNYDYESPDSNFKLIELEFDTEDPNLLKPNQLLIQSLYFSNDPAQKGWFAPYKSYHDISPLNTPAPARGIAKIIKSTSPRFKEGDFIQAKVNWATYSIIDDDLTSNFPVDPTKVSSLSKYLSVFGSTTLTAYLAAFKYSGLKPENKDTVWLVTGAAGAVGSALVQILVGLFNAKKIIAVAGGADKVKYVESLGSSVVGVDYRSKTYDEDFAKALGDDEVDVFVDQVGGELLNKGIGSLKVHGRIVQVGAISRYNNTNEVFDFSNYSRVITQRLSIQGMVIVDDAQDFFTIIQDLIKEFQAGKLDITNFRETIVEAKGDDFKKVPELWSGLFKGVNTGKYITKVADY